MRRATEEIKLRRVLRIIAAERNRLRPHRQINAIQLFEREGLSICHHFTGGPDIDDPHLAPFEEECPPRFLVIRQFHRRQRHHAADDKPVQVCERAGEFPGHEKIVDMKSVPQFLRGHPDHVLRAWHPTNRVIEHAPKLETPPTTVNANLSFQGKRHGVPRSKTPIASSHCPSPAPQPATLNPLLPSHRLKPEPLPWKTALRVSTFPAPTSKHRSCVSMIVTQVSFAVPCVSMTVPPTSKRRSRVLMFVTRVSFAVPRVSMVVPPTSKHLSRVSMIVTRVSIALPPPTI
jgi:hypothetical protein